MSNPPFNQSALSPDQQLKLLKERGLIICDPTVAKQCLETVSFHRLSAYFTPYEMNKFSHQFKSQTTFQHIWHLYTFDRELRLLVLDVIERIEVALRTALSNHLSVKHGAYWYIKDQLFKKSWTKPKASSYRKTLSPKDHFFVVVDDICKDRKHNESINRYYQQYSEPRYPPSWIILEFLSFGKCTSLYRYLRSPQDKSMVSHVFGVHHKIFESALEPLRYTRNLCANHARLWDRWFVYKPRYLRELEVLNCPPGTLKEQMALLRIFLNAISPQSNWKEHIYNLFARYEDFVIFELMGFSQNWHNDLFWKA